MTYYDSNSDSRDSTGVFLKLKWNDKTRLNIAYKQCTSKYIDLYFPEYIDVRSGEMCLIDMKIQCQMVRRTVDITKNLYPPPTVEKNLGFSIYPKSTIYETPLQMVNFVYSKNSDSPLQMTNTVDNIEASYRGNIKIKIKNTSTKTYRINKGEALFQICSPTLEEIKLELVE